MHSNPMIRMSLQARQGSRGFFLTDGRRIIETPIMAEAELSRWIAEHQDGFELYTGQDIDDADTDQQFSVQSRMVEFRRRPRGKEAVQLVNLITGKTVRPTVFKGVACVAENLPCILAQNQEWLTVKSSSPEHVSTAAPPKESVPSPNDASRSNRRQSKVSKRDSAGLDPIVPTSKRTRKASTGSAKTNGALLTSIGPAINESVDQSVMRATLNNSKSELKPSPRSEVSISSEKQSASPQELPSNRTVPLRVALKQRRVLNGAKTTELEKEEPKLGVAPSSLPPAVNGAARDIRRKELGPDATVEALHEPRTTADSTPQVQNALDEGASKRVRKPRFLFNPTGVDILVDTVAAAQGDTPNSGVTEMPTIPKEGVSARSSLMNGNGIDNNHNGSRDRKRGKVTLQMKEAPIVAKSEDDSVEPQIARPQAEKRTRTRRRNVGAATIASERDKNEDGDANENPSDTANFVEAATKDQVQVPITRPRGRIRARKSAYAKDSVSESNVEYQKNELMAQAKEVPNRKDAELMDNAAHHLSSTSESQQLNGRTESSTQQSTKVVDATARSATTAGSLISAEKLLPISMDDILTATDSALIGLDLREIISLKSFIDDLDASDRAVLLELLPEIDVRSAESVSSLFRSNMAFVSSLSLYQRLLASGVYDLAAKAKARSERRRMTGWSKDKERAFEDFYAQREDAAAGTPGKQQKWREFDKQVVALAQSKLSAASGPKLVTLETKPDGSNAPEINLDEVSSPEGERGVTASVIPSLETAAPCPTSPAEHRSGITE